MRHGTLLDSPKYRKFTHDRDLALEQIHNNAQTDISRILFDLLTQVDKEIAHVLLYSTPESAVQWAHIFEQESAQLFNQFVPKFVARFQSMRKACYILSYL